jgi:acetyl-CoA acetyltransferase
VAIDGLAAIAGVAESDLGVTGLTPLQLNAQAVRRALDDAGLELKDVDGLATTGLSRFSATLLGEYLGLQPVWTDSTMAGGSSFDLFVARAARAIRDGLCEVAVVSYGSNQRSARSRRLEGVVEAGMPTTEFEVPFAPLRPISLYAMAAQRHMHEFGTTSEQLAEIAVAAREWALLNPAAFMHDAGPLTVEEVVASPLISSPLHRLDCCLQTDGGGAVVLTSVERARTLAKPPVLVLGHGEASTNMGFVSIPDLTATGANVSGPRALEMAGVSLGDVDVVEVYDSFTITVLLTLEGLGFCERGEGGAFVEDGKLRPGGGFALNTSGGGLSYCHPGMFGIFLVIEAVRQLRGEVGARQVDAAELALCHGTGGELSTHVSVVLGRDR